jgi:hypothetical protein
METRIKKAPAAIDWPPVAGTGVDDRSPRRVDDPATAVGYPNSSVTCSTVPGGASPRYRGESLQKMLYVSL